MVANTSIIVVHPHQIKVSIPYSQPLRVSRICSSEKEFGADTYNMKEWFLAKDYPEKVVNDQMDKVVPDKNSPVKKSSEILHLTRKSKILVN